MKTPYYYTVKYGSKLQGGGCNGTFKLFCVENNKIVLKHIHKQNIVSMSPGYGKTLNDVIKREIDPDGFLNCGLEELEIFNK